MLYNHCLSFARMSSLIRSILFIESFSLLTNSMIWIFIFIPTYKFTASYFSDLPNGIDKDLQTIFNEAVKNFKLEDVLNNLNQNPTVLLSVYIISFVSLYIVHTSIVLFIQDMIIKNVSDQMGLNLEIMKILKDQTISATQKYYIVSSMLLESQITLYRDKNLTQIEPLARTYPSMYNFKNDEEKKESVKKNEYLNVLYDWIGRILNSQYKYQFIGFIFLVIYIITKSFIFYIIMENKYLMEKVLLNFKSDEKYNTGIIIACGVFDLLHILIILIIGLIFSCKSKWKVRIKDKNYTQIINETEEDEIIIGIEESTEGSDEFKFTKTINRILNHFRKNDGFAALANIIDLTDQLSNLKVINELLKDTQIHPKASLFQIYDAIELKIDEENISFVFDDPVDKYFNFSKNIVKCNRLIKERNDIMENNIEMIKIYNVPIDKLKDSLNDTWNKSDDIKKKFPMKIKNDDKELRKKMTLMDTLFKKSDDEVKVTKNKNGKQSRNINTSIKHDEVTENMDGKHSSSINMTIKHDEVKENTTKQKGDEVRVKGEVKKEITKNKDGKQSINIQIKHNKIAEKSREDDKVVIKVINKKLNLHKNKLKKEIKKPKRSS
ncbi:hypothetical protein A3Q56_06161 [Intoshia linei]|uniref:Uncharacterized protein n=1 Tax=Intoshia linei TaxID=1819745 RepID=A0A177AXN4_9BILA|nr:hypothetical protein A3Q56_06161 [Intoshia linei]